MYCIYCIYNIARHHRVILPISFLLVNHYDSIPSHHWLERHYPWNLSPPKVRNNSLIPCVQSCPIKQCVGVTSSEASSSGAPPDPPVRLLALLTRLRFSAWKLHSSPSQQEERIQVVEKCDAICLRFWGYLYMYVYTHNKKHGCMLSKLHLRLKFKTRRLFFPRPAWLIRPTQSDSTPYERREISMISTHQRIQCLPRSRTEPDDNAASYRGRPNSRRC